MNGIVIFGTGKLGELLSIGLEEDCGVTTAAFCVDSEYLHGDSFLGKPLVTPDMLATRFPPSRHDAIVAIGYADCNKARLKSMTVLEELGYSLASYVSPQAMVPPGFTPPPNTIIFEGAVIQRTVSVERGLLMWPGACVCHHARIGETVFIGPGATVCGGTDIGPRALIGAGSVVRDFLTVGEGAVVGAGSVLLRDLPAEALCNGGESPVTLDGAKKLTLWPPKTARA